MATSSRCIAGLWGTEESWSMGLRLAVRPLLRALPIKSVLPAACETYVNIFHLIKKKTWREEGSKPVWGF